MHGHRGETNCRDVNNGGSTQPGRDYEPAKKNMIEGGDEADEDVAGTAFVATTAATAATCDHFIVTVVAGERMKTTENKQQQRDQQDFFHSPQSFDPTNNLAFDVVANRLEMRLNTRFRWRALFTSVCLLHQEPVPFACRVSYIHTLPRFTTTSSNTHTHTTCAASSRH